MHIIVDGYNLIRQSDILRSSERISLEEGRKALIKRLSAYRNIKQKHHEITVVFDGTEGGTAIEERDRQYGIDIIYSRKGEKADDVIKKIIEKKREQMLVVTSDKEISRYACRRGITAISSKDFEEKIEKISVVLPAQPMPDEFHKDEEFDNFRDVRKKGPSRRPSKKQKAANTALRKL